MEKLKSNTAGSRWEWAVGIIALLLLLLHVVKAADVALLQSAVMHSSQAHTLAEHFARRGWLQWNAPYIEIVLLLALCLAPFKPLIADFGRRARDRWLSSQSVR